MSPSAKNSACAGVFMGIYVGHGVELHVTRHAQTGGGMRGPELMAISAVHFLAESLGADRTFAPATGLAQELTLAQRGRTQVLKRKTTP